ncbi:MAG: FAD-binding oxidoreductase [Oscillospiraceae bacterium]
MTDSAARVAVALKAARWIHHPRRPGGRGEHLEGARLSRRAVEAVSEQAPVDLVVPINRTADFIKFVHETEKKSGMQMVAFGHAGDGNVHLCMVRGKRSDAEWEHDLHKNMTTVYNYAYSLGGLTSGEHGIGVAKRPYFLGATAPENLDLMRAPSRPHSTRSTF